MDLGFPKSAEDLYNQFGAIASAEGIQVSAYQNKTKSLFSIILMAVAMGMYKFYPMINFCLRQSFPQTSVGIWLDYLGTKTNSRPRKTAQGSSGSVFVPLEVSTPVPVLSEFTVNDLVFENGVGAVASLFSIPLIVAVRSGLSATVTVASTASMATGMVVNVTGFSSTEYNGAKVITVLSPTQFTFEISPLAPSPATGAGVAEYSGAVVTVESTTTGLSTNLFPGTVLQYDNTDCFVLGSGILGGTNIETDEEYRTSTVVPDWKIRPNNFNIDAIEQVVRTVPDVSFVHVLPATPTHGEVEIYVLFNGTTGTPQQLLDVKTAVMSIAQAVTYEAFVYVLSPVIVPVNVVIQGLSVDTPTMRAAVTTSITTYINNLERGESVKVQKLSAAIQNTIDQSTFQSVQEANLQAPVANLPLTVTQVAQLGTITWVP
jgi:uncharacterized phage protein gp47/JayE